MATRLKAMLTRRMAAVGALALAVAMLGVVLTSTGGGDDQADAESSGLPTVALERRDLAEQVSVDGTLGYEGEAEVINRLSGTVTWLAQEGSVVRRGERLFAVDDEPVILLYGDVPAYRELTNGVRGADVKQLEANLSELGFDADGAMTTDDEFTSATSEAVTDWQDSLGAKKTGMIALGEVVFQSGPRRVNSLDVALGSDAGSSGGGAAGTGVSAETSGTVEMTLVSYVSVDGSAGAVAKKKEGKKQDGKKKPSGEGTEEPPGAEKPSTGDEGSANAHSEQQTQQSSRATTEQAQTDGSATPGTAEDAQSAAVSNQVMTTTSTSRVVTVDLDPNQVSVARRGSTVGVALPDGNEVKGRIETVGTVAQSSTGTSTDGTTTEGQSTEDATIAVTISLSSKTGSSSLDQAPVTVDLTEGVRQDVFVVPVAALIGTAGGGYAIVVDEGAESRQITIEPGLFADGYVEIDGAGLEEGMQVEVPDE